MLSLYTHVLLHALAGDVSATERRVARVHVWPLDAAVCRESTHLDFTGDPADELIAATSIVHRVPLLTRDKRIRRSKLVPFARASR